MPIKALIFISIIGMAGLFWATKRGIGLGPDSARYIDCAKNISQGQGYSTGLQKYRNPISVKEYIQKSKDNQSVLLLAETQFPPLFSCVLAAMKVFGFNGQHSAQTMIIILFGINIFLGGYLAARHATKTRFIAIFAGLILLSSEIMLDVHSNVLSEPLYICLMLFSFLFMTIYLERSNKIYLILGGVSVGLAFMTRYAGVSLVISSILILWYCSENKIKNKISDILIFLSLSCLPVTLFILRNILLTGRATNRAAYFAFPDQAFLKNILLSLSSILLPNFRRLGSFPGKTLIIISIDIILVIGLLTLFYLVGKRGWLKISNNDFSASRPHLPLLLGVHILVYLSFIILSKIFIDPIFTADIRILSPLAISVIILLFYFSRVIQWIKNKRIRYLGYFALSLYGFAYLFSGGVWLYKYHEIGRGYNGLEWKQPEIQEIMKAAKQYAHNIPIFTNDDSALYLFTGLYSYPATLARNKIGSMKKEIENEVILYVRFKTKLLDQHEQRVFGLSSMQIDQMLIRDLSLDVLVTNSKGTLFRKKLGMNIKE